MKKTIIGQQGEVRIYRIDAMPDNVTSATIERDNQGRPIISHSEKGHHHVIDCAGIDVMERPSAGMTMLFAIVKSPTALIQTAQVAHEKHTLDAGCYMFTIDREYDPFAEQVRRVAD